MRHNFPLMKEINRYTNIEPNQRYDQLSEIIQTIQERDEAKKELYQWQITFDEKLIEFQGRTMESETIIYRNVMSILCFFFYMKV